MNKYELSKYDFELLDRMLGNLIRQGMATALERQRAEILKDKFAAAHTGWLETEDD